LKKTLRKNEALQLLAVKGPMNVYQIWNALKETSRAPKSPKRSAYQKAINSLMKEGYVRIDKTTAWYGKNRTVKTYQITIEGLLEALKDDKLWGAIDEIAEKNEQLLPEYFGLWKKFKEMKKDDIAVKLFTYAVTKLQQGIPSFPEKIENRKPTLRDWLPRMAIYPWEAQVEQVLTEKEALAFLSVILTDERADKLYVDTLQWITDSYRSGLKSFEDALKKYKEVKYGVDVAKQVVKLLETDKTSLEILKVLREDEELWKVFVQMYPKMKDAKDEQDEQAIVEKIKQARAAGLAW
jgi:DNA-binding PadR family transcriptional regulator